MATRQSGSRKAAPRGGSGTKRKAAGRRGGTAKNAPRSRNARGSTAKRAATRSRSAAPQGLAIDLTKPTPAAKLSAARRKRTLAAKELEATRGPEPKKPRAFLGHHSARFAGMRSRGTGST